MTEQSHDNDPRNLVRAEVAEYAKQRIDWIGTAAQEIGGEGASIEEVFPPHTAVRDDAPIPDWDGEQEATARELGHRLGYASEYDVVSGLKGKDFIEGGKVWKMLAEVEAAAGDTLMISGSPRRLIGDDEKEFLVNRFVSRLGEDLSEEDRAQKTAAYREKLAEKSEYDAASDIAAELVASEPFVDIAEVSNPMRRVLPFGYSVTEGNPVVTEPTSQFIYEGKNAKDQEIVLMRIDHEDFLDEETGEQKYRFQPSPLRRLGIISDILSQYGYTETPVVFVTSNAYASRQIDPIRAGLADGRQYGVTMYGRSALATIKHEPIEPGARLNQLPGDIRLMYENLLKLRAETTDK